MSIAGGAPYKSTRAFSLNGLRYKVLPRDLAKIAGVARSWEEQRVSIQDVPLQELAIPFSSFHQGHGFTYDGMDSVYQHADGWDASSPGKIKTWARTAQAASAALGTALPRGRLGWLYYDDTNGYLYMLRGRYISKYAVDLTTSSWSKAVADYDLGASNVVAGRPAYWKGKLYIPIANTSHVAQVFKELTFGGGGADSYASGPAGQEALCFTTFKNLLVRANTNTIASCATTPLVGANWGGTGTVATSEVSHSGDTITDLGVYDQYIVVRNNRGLWTFTENLKATNELPDLASIIDWEGAGMCYSNGRMLLPHKTGLVGWHPGSWGNIGPEQEGALEGGPTKGWGRTRFCLPVGRYVYTAINNAPKGEGYIVSYVPARIQGRGPLIPHCHFMATGSFEGLALIDNGTDTTSALAAIQVSADGLTATPCIYKVPRSGMTAADDPLVDHAASAATFTASRSTRPARSVQKLYRTFECYLDMTPESNTPGLQVWASIAGAAAIQLLDGAGAAKTALTTGFHQFFFPKTSAAAGAWCELQFKVPALGGGQVAVDVRLREGVLRCETRPLRASVVRTTLFLDDKPDLEDRTGLHRTAAQQEADLRALDARGGAAGGIAYTGPNGESGYVEIRELGFNEVFWREGEPAVKIAHLTMAVSAYQ